MLRQIGKHCSRVRCADCGEVEGPGSCLVFLVLAVPPDLWGLECALIGRSQAEDKKKSFIMRAEDEANI